MDCPTCAATLVPVHREGIEVDTCPDGHGSWLDAGELQRAVDATAAPRSDEEKAHARATFDRDTAGEEAAPARACLRCGEQMLRTEYDEWSGVVIDICPTHGVWMDHEELERAEAWIESSDEALQPERERLAAIQDEVRAELDGARDVGVGGGPFGAFARALHLIRNDAAMERRREERRG